jgi:hypothetical protein
MARIGVIIRNLYFKGKGKVIPAQVVEVLRFARG